MLVLFSKTKLSTVSMASKERNFAEKQTERVQEYEPHLGPVSQSDRFKSLTSHPR